MTFEELNLSKPLYNALQDLGFTSPTAIQEKVFALTMSGKDVVGLAQTGTGKTFAYLLPSLRLHKFTKEKHPTVLILVPTRELVIQIVKEIEKLTTYMTLRVIGVYGGVNTKVQIAELSDGVDFLVATPGRLVDLIDARAINPRYIKRLIIDEFDEMLNLGFRAQLNLIFAKIPEKRQNLLFSATLSEEIEEVITSQFNSPERIEATPVGTPLTNIEQSYYEVPNFYTKVNLLKFLLASREEMSKVLVFVATKHLADELFEQNIIPVENAVAVIHSNKSQNHRFASVNSFEDGSSRVLIATDIIARGIDVAEVTHVINFDLPDEPQNYIHRIGRTGRIGRKGISISFVTPKDLTYLAGIQELMKYEIPEVEFPREVEISDRQLKEEMPKNLFMIEPEKTIVRSKESGAAFHEKLPKNKKTNTRRDFEAEMKLKYGKQYRSKKTR